MLDEDREGIGAEPETPAVRAARALGYAGLAPFVVLSLWLYAIAPDHEWRDGTIVLLVVYGAVILSFLGGVRWGMALSDGVDQAPADFAAAIVPALVGWLAVAMPPPYCFAVLAVAFAAHGAWDTLAVHQMKAPDWYGRMRMILTMVVVATMIVAFIATG